MPWWGLALVMAAYYFLGPRARDDGSVLWSRSLVGVGGASPVPLGTVCGVTGVPSSGWARGNLGSTESGSGRSIYIPALHPSPPLLLRFSRHYSLDNTLHPAAVALSCQLQHDAHIRFLCGDWYIHLASSTCADK